MLRHHPRGGRRAVILVLLGLLAGILAACSDSATTTDTATGDGADTTAPEGAEAEDGTTSTGAADAGPVDNTDGAFPVQLDTPEGTVTIPAAPERIVSLSPTGTEMLFAIGAGDQVEAADSYSNYPPEAPTTDLSAFEPNLEAIAAYQPDLLVMSQADPVVVAGMDDIDVPVLILPAAQSLDDTYDQIALLGMATGHLNESAATNAQIRAGVEAAVADQPTPTEPVRVYHELDDTFFSASSASFIGQLYDLLGWENIADAADPDRTGYPQLQAEEILGADPTVIVFTDAYGYTAADIAARPGWDQLTAVETGSVIEVDADIASRWGPRVVELLDAVTAGVSAPTG
ncbi:MAG: ABC transporter substrate-binding protein [Acidimicrobiales bacterium]